MYKIAICDDKKTILNTIHELCNLYAERNNINIADFSYTNPKRLLSDLEDHKYYDLYFIDIEMPQMNGLDVIKSIKQFYPDALVIVLTSYAHYAIEAIELDVFRYLVKNRLSKSFDDYIQAAINRLTTQSGECYFINSPRKKIKIFCKDIIYSYKDKETKVTIFCTKGGEIRERKPIKQVWNDLKQISENFVFVERGCFVNMFYVSGISKNEVLLENGTSIRIGIRYAENFKKELENFWRKHIWSD